jgi:uroporphyrin-III C-methyltransferase
MDGSGNYQPPELTAGSVWLVGAGPGDPGLVSWLALSALRAADAVIYDPAIEAGTIALIPPGRLAQPALPTGNHGSIIERCISLAREGWRVVRLIEGDPLADPAGVAAALALSAAEIPYRVGPGITAMIAGPAFAGVPVTRRGVNAAVRFVTLGEDDDVATISLGEIDGTAVVVTLAPRQLRPFAARLRADGAAPETPLLALLEAGHSGQRAFESTLGDPLLPASAVLEHRIVVVIGDVVATRRELTAGQEDVVPMAPLPAFDHAAFDHGGGFSMVGIAG